MTTVPLWLNILADRFRKGRRPDIPPPHHCYYGYHVFDAYVAGYQQALADQGMELPAEDPITDRGANEQAAEKSHAETPYP